MSRSVIQALSPFSVASVLCAVGSLLLPIETKGRALLVRPRGDTLTRLQPNIIYSLILNYVLFFSKTPDVPKRFFVFSELFEV